MRLSLTFGGHVGWHEEDVAAADGLLDLDVDLAVGELFDDPVAEVHAEVVGDLLLSWSGGGGRAVSGGAERIN